MGPLFTATLQGAAVSAVSNLLGQFVNARLAEVSLQGRGLAVSGTR